MLTIHHVSKSFGVEPILKEISFSISKGERLGLVGPNGCGKTTLLRILAGEDRPDSGGVTRDPDLRTGYLPQGFLPSPEETLESFLRRVEGDLPGLAARLESLAGALAAAPAPAAGVEAALQREYDAVLARLEGLSESAGRGPETLAALGLDRLPLDTPVANLSGGQKTRLALAGVLLSSPQLLLLDEPTNHLDLEMLEWLEEWLVSFRGAALVVSHDRAFLDRTATDILELDPHTHQGKAYAGNYTAYLEQKVAEREKQWQAYAGQQEEIARLRTAAAEVRGKAQFRKGGKGDSGDKFAKGFFANRAKETIRRAKHLEARLERLLTTDRIDKPKATWQMKLDFGETPASGKDVIAAEGLAVGYRGEGGERMLLRDLDLHVRQGSRVALIGPNGAGKTTLLRTIAGVLPPLAGSVRLGANVRTGYMAQEQEDLDRSLNALTTVRKLASFTETDARAFLHQFLFTGDEVFTQVGSLSYGERARLSLACLVARGCNLLLLDEPINHLDIPSRARFEQALAGFEGTVLAVVHDRFFIHGFASEIWEVRGQGIDRLYL
jgi:ATPase subunit of ABC transporter with duplicated ATPase domains